MKGVCFLGLLAFLALHWTGVMQASWNWIWMWTAGTWFLESLFE